jgi:gamma-glutamylcyclotransferase (GGCT)/AIG2-like uncharacterized protein YtfP
MEKDYLYVYGSLKKGANNSLQRRLLKQADYVSDGVFQGRLFRLKGYPAAVPSTHPGDKVHGELYRLRNAEAAFKWLDAYELCMSKSWLIPEFLRRKQIIHLTRGKTLAAWIYLYHRSTLGLSRVKNGKY